MPDRESDVLVVGAGVVGAAIFHRLATHGRPVTMIECDQPGWAGTGHSGGVVRCFHENPVLSDRAMTGWRFLRDLRRHTGTDVPMTRTGFLYFPAAERTRPAEEEARRLSHQVPVRWLTADEVDHRFGHLVRADGQGAVWEAEAGFLDPIAVVRALVRAGQAAGGRLLAGVRVLGPLRAGGRLAGVRTSAGPLPGQGVVLAAGAGSPALCAEFGVDHDLYLKAIQVDLWQSADSVDGHPSFTDGESGLNGRPDPDSGGVYVGYPVDPPGQDGQDGQNGVIGQDGAAGGPLQPGHTRRTAMWGRKRLRWLDDSAASGGVRAVECFTKGTAGRVRRTAEEPAVVLATGFNGSGFRMAPWAAARVSELLAARDAEENRSDR
jgi:glycine/D-amino acid oxidase-like deaminating enzyme